MPDTMSGRSDSAGNLRAAAITLDTEGTDKELAGTTMQVFFYTEHHCKG